MLLMLDVLAGNCSLLTRCCFLPKLIDGSILPSFAFLLATFDSDQQAAKLVGRPHIAINLKTHFLADALQVNLSIAALNTRLGFFQIAVFETFQGFPPLRLTMQTNTSALKRLEHKLSKRGA